MTNEGTQTASLDQCPQFELLGTNGDGKFSETLAAVELNLNNFTGVSVVQNRRLETAFI